MKTQLRVVLILLFSLFYLYMLKAQPIFDSVSVSKPKRSRFSYQFQDPAISSISIKSSGGISRPRTPGEGLGNYAGDLGMQAFGSILGSVNSSREVICLPSGKLKCNNPSLDWEVILACPGVMNTEKEKSDDGVSIRKTAIMNWKEKARGIILEAGDTISFFDIISEPVGNSMVSQWSEAVYASRPSRYPAPEAKRIMNYSMDNLFDFYENFGMIGSFRGEPFVLLFNHEQGESWLFKSDDLKMIFYADIDDFQYVPKKDKLVPYIKWKHLSSGSERHDFIRLAMTSRYLTKILSIGYYPLN